MIITLGYTGTTPHQIHTLVEARHAILADIRYSPASRNPAFSGKAFAAALGARYVHLRALGNQNYKGGPMQIVDLPGGCEAVRTLLTRYPAVVLMCVCAELRTCHRLPVATAVAATLGCAIEHAQLGPEERQVPMLFAPRSTP